MIPETMTEGPFELVSQWVGALPILSAFIDALGVEELLNQAILTDSRSELSPARALGVLLRNLIEGPSPLYGLSEWVRSRDPRGLGLCDEEVAAINDDRVGRGLDRLYDANRGALGAEIVLGAIRRYGIDVDALHNDSTSISLTGEYRGADGSLKRGKPSVKITRGHPRPPPRSQAAPVGLDRLRRWCGPGPLPPHRRQHQRFELPHRSLGDPYQAGGAGRLRLLRRLQARQPPEHGPYPPGGRALHLGASPLPQGRCRVSGLSQGPTDPAGFWCATTRPRGLRPTSS